MRSATLIEEGDGQALYVRYKKELSHGHFNLFSEQNNVRKRIHFKTQCFTSTRGKVVSTKARSGGGGGEFENRSNQTAG